MKKLYYIGTIAAIAATAILPTIAIAESSGAGTDYDSGTAAAGNASTTLTGKLRADYNARIENARNNEQSRDLKLQGKRGFASSTLASTTRGKMGEGSENDRDERDASSTAPEYRRGISKTVRADIYRMQLNHLVSQLNRALNNLKQIRSRIGSRIEKASASGRDMTNAKSLLTIADAKITAARNAIDALATLTPTASSTNVTSTSTTATSTSSGTSTPPSTIDLGKPRQVGKSAIQSVNEARKALNAVVVAIAHSMGFKIGEDGKIVPPTATTTATTTSQTGGSTSTTTATTTNSTATTTNSTATTTNTTSTTTATTTP